jgi:hypothetical protein
VCLTDKNHFIEFGKHFGMVNTKFNDIPFAENDSKIASAPYDVDSNIAGPTYAADSNIASGAYAADSNIVLRMLLTVT